MEDNNYWEVGAEYNNILVETCEEKGASRPRVKPVGLPDIKVNFPRKLRETHSIGTRFNIDGKVSQKPGQEPYLYADRKTIEVIDDYKPEYKRKAILKEGCISGRAYEYIEE